MPRGLMDFAGDWRVTRVIEDRLGPPGQFEGTAALTPDGPGLTYTEKGRLTLGSAPPMQAERSYLWREESDLIQVLFDDARPFHRFDPNLGGAGERHYCDPDIYDVVYALDDWPNWSSSWTVTGPRKDYTMRTQFAR
ncbi:MAG: DUF6314 family protein [Pseudomonadota bacterium]